MIGCQRSGTTLTGQIVGAHSGSLFIDETDGLYSVIAQGNAAVNESKLRSVVSTAKEKYVEEKLPFLRVHDYKLVAKAPNLTYRYEELSRLKPTPKIIYPVRDVRSVVASILSISSKRPILPNQSQAIIGNQLLRETYAKEITILENSNTPDHVRAAVIWKIKSGAYLDFANVGLQPLLFRYEELIQSPALYARTLAEHCGLNFENQMLEHHKIMRGKGAGLTSRTRSIDSSSLTRWRDELSCAQVEEIMEIGEHTMMQLGYSDDV